jgi:hypothetical protein
VTKQTKKEKKIAETMDALRAAFTTKPAPPPPIPAPVLMVLAVGITTSGMLLRHGPGSQ